ncbi:MAG: TIM barrel protein [Turicibacter sp.]
MNVQMGCLARYFNRYADEVAFAKNHGFSFMQVWYDNRGICLHELDVDPIHLINEYKFPTLIHAVLNVNEFDEHIPKLVDILSQLGHNELIIHPICENEPIDETTIDRLSEKVANALDKLTAVGVTLYLENNSKLDPIFTDTHEIKKLFTAHSKLEFLLDLAHIDHMKHLEEMVEIKRPQILHIADRHFSVVHEHLPVGQGEIDFELIFNTMLKNYEGKIILEIIQSDLDLVNSKRLIERVL